MSEEQREEHMSDKWMDERTNEWMGKQTNGMDIIRNNKIDDLLRLSIISSRLIINAVNKTKTFKRFKP